MHMSDALITPIVGGSMMATSTGVMAYSIRSIKNEVYEKKLPLMGVMGAFIFATQMINFAIPGTGSSGHIGGGMLLSIVLGPGAAFITMACVLLIQALFFADGGLLAFGCNLMNLGFFTAFVAYPLIYKPIVKGHLNKKRLLVGAILASVVGLQLGSLGVVVQTWLSGRTDLDFMTFIAFMQPIHLAIGLVEGVITAAVVGYIYTQKKSLIYDASEHIGEMNYRKVIMTLIFVTLIIGGFLSLLASSNPDGLEWSIEKTIGEDTLSEPTEVDGWFESIQEKFAFLPDYSFRSKVDNEGLGTSFSGLVGSLITLAITVLIGLLIRRNNRKRKHNE